MKKRSKRNIVLCNGYKFSVVTHYFGGAYGGINVDLVKVNKVSPNGEIMKDREIFFDFTHAEYAEGMTPAEAMGFLIKVPKKYYDEEFEASRFSDTIIYTIKWLAGKLPRQQYIAAKKLMDQRHQKYLDPEVKKEYQEHDALISGILKKERLKTFEDRLQKEGDVQLIYNNYGYGSYIVTKEEWIKHFSSPFGKGHEEMIALVNGKISVQDYIKKHGARAHRRVWSYNTIIDGKEYVIGDGINP